MRVLHLAAEIYPLVKTGGLADVIAALPPALAARQIDVRLLLPGHPAILDGLRDARPVITLGPAFGAAVITLYRGRLDPSGIPAYVIDAPFLYRREGNPYVDPTGIDWADNHRRFALLGWAAAHLASGALHPDWTPQIVHGHHWHAGLPPAYIAQHGVDGVVYANPLPHVLMLTAIVVGVATLGVGLAVVQVIFLQFRSIEEDEILEQIRNSDG